MYVFHPAVLRPGQYQLLPVGKVCCACKPDWRPQRGRTSILSQKTVPVWTAEEQFRFSFLTDVTQEVIMNPFSILMFCFSGALFLYAVLLYITKDYKLIPRGYVSKTDDKQAYTKQVAEIVALVAVAPAHCGYIALFSMGWSVVVLIVEMVLAIWVGTKIMQ